MSNSSESSNATAIATDNDVIATDSSGSNSSVPGVIVSTTIVNSFDLDNSIEPSSTPSIHTALGYCHVCNKQNRINTETYTCVQCNCGFIELFDINESDRSNLRSESLLDNSTTNTRTNNTFLNNFIYSNSNSQLNRNVNNDSSANMNTAYCQWVSRFNRNIDPSHISTSSSSSSTAANGIESSINDIFNPSGDSSNSTSNTSVSSTSGSRDHPSRSNASFHYRLRRHTNPHSISSNNGATAGGSGTVGNSFGSMGTSNSTTFSPSFSSRHHHRHRFHRSPTSRFNFNFLDDDEILNDHGAIIITTLINQLRNTNRGAAPASEIQIDSLPVIDIDQIQVEKIAQCAICMEEFLLNETAKQLPCKHLYHDPCIVQWLKLHATCPVCRKNINGTNEQEQENEQNERTNLLNIFPISASSSLLSAAAVAAASSRLNQQNNSTSTSSTESRDSQNRRSLLRNRQFFRIQIRQSVNNNNNNNNATSSSTSNSQTDNNEYSLRRSRRLTSPSTLPTSGSNSNSTVGSGNNMPNVILPRYSSILTADRSELANESSSFSAFSIMNELSSRPSSSSSSSTNTTGATSNAEANTTTSGSRIGNLMDRIFSRCRPTTLSNRFSQQQQYQASTSNQSRSSLPDYHHHHHHHQSSTSPPTVSRLSHLFRHRHLRRQLNTDHLSSSTNSSTNSGTEFFQLFHRTAPLTDTLLRETDTASSSNNNSDNNENNNSNVNNSSLGSASSFLNRASTIFDSEILSSPLTSNLPLETTLLSDLFDLSEEASQIDMPTRRSLRRSRSPNTSGSNQEAFTITIDDDDDDDDEDDVDDEDDESNTTNNNSSNNNSNPIIIDSDTAIESSSSSASSNETNLIDTIDLINENNSLISSQSSNSTTAISSLQHAAKKRKTEST